MQRRQEHVLHDILNIRAPTQQSLRQSRHARLIQPHPLLKPFAAGGGRRDGGSALDIRQNQAPLHSCLPSVEVLVPNRRVIFFELKMENGKWKIISYFDFPLSLVYCSGRANPKCPLSLHSNQPSACPL